jgi:CBS domain-containing protein
VAGAGGPGRLAPQRVDRIRILVQIHGHVIYESMFLVPAFKQPIAAVIGISKKRWVSVVEGENMEMEAMTLMREKRFDCIPIETSDGRCVEYFVAKPRENPVEAVRTTVEFRDTLELDTNFEDLLRHFKSRDREEFFLTGDGQVQGMVAKSNLSCNYVRGYLYSIFGTCEMMLAERVTKYMDVDSVIEYLEHKASTGNASSRRYAEDQLKRYKRNISSNRFNTILDNLYFRDLMKLLNSFAENRNLRFSDCEIGQLSDLRNAIAHPSGGMLSFVNDIDLFIKVVDLAHEVIFYLGSSYTE